MMRWIVPGLMLVGAGLVSWQIYVHRPRVQAVSQPLQPPLVRVTAVQPETVRIPVESQGTVTPAIHVSIAARLSGGVVEVADALVPGGFVKKGDPLVRIDARDYDVAVARAVAEVARAEERFTQARAEYQQKLKEYAGVDPHTVAEIALRRPQFESAQKQLEAARAELRFAQLQRQWTRVRAPFDARVVAVHVNVGHYVSPGTVLVELDAVDRVQVRLPFTLAQAALLDLPLRPGEEAGGDGPDVTLYQEIAGRSVQWEGKVVRTEARLDLPGRLLYAVVEVEDPYGLREAARSRPPLLVGSFVRARFQGKPIEGVYVLPGTAVHHRDQVWLAGSANRLQRQAVDVLFRDAGRVYVNGGLWPGARVITSALETPVEGMSLQVRSAEGEQAP